MRRNLRILFVAGLLATGLATSAGADEFAERLAEVEARCGAIDLARELPDQTSAEWLMVLMAQEAIRAKDAGDLEEAARLIRDAASLARADQ